MTDKAVKKETENLIKRLKYIQNPRNKKGEAMAIKLLQQYCVVDS